MRVNRGHSELVLEKADGDYPSLVRLSLDDSFHSADLAIGHNGNRYF